jgi:protein tyrosine phosphatase (PTP) superfamily phosphohydrolase (DUF442 family)
VAPPFQGNGAPVAPPPSNGNGAPVAPPYNGSETPAAPPANGNGVRVNPPIFGNDTETPAVPPVNGDGSRVPPPEPPSGVKVLPPEPPSGVKVLPPEPPNGVKLMPPAQTEQELPPVRKDQIAQPEGREFPQDIFQFNLVEEKVASGLQPLSGGYTWLKDQGYRTIVHLRPAGEEDSAARTVVENLGMSYLTVEISPRTLSRELVQEFSRTVRDPQRQPVFVYDRRGMLTGTLWYLHFRLTDNLPDPEARERAKRLGLKEETNEEYADLWLAIQRVLRST